MGRIFLSDVVLKLRLNLRKIKKTTDKLYFSIGISNLYTKIKKFQIISSKYFL